MCHQDAHGGTLGDTAGTVPLLWSHASFEFLSWHAGPDPERGPMCADCHENRSDPADLTCLHFLSHSE